MQCRLPRKNAPNKPSLTWYFNETITWSKGATYAATFTCNGVSYAGIRHLYTTGSNQKSYLQYMGGSYINVGYMIARPPKAFTWIKEAYRTITFNAPPTGDLLTWLEANATLQ